MQILELQNLSKQDDLVAKVGEIAHFYPNLDFGYILVSPSLLSDMLRELHPFAHLGNYPNGVAGFKSLALQTHHGQLYVRVERGLEDDDFVILDRSGNRLSYKHFFVNEMVENIVLRGINE